MDPERLSIALPASITDREVVIDVTAVRPDVLYECLVLGLRARTFDVLYGTPRNGRAEGERVASAVWLVFSTVRRPTDGPIEDTTVVSVPRFVEATTIYEVCDPIAPLDLAEVPAITRVGLIVDGFRSFPADQLRDRLLAEEFVLPGEERKDT